MSVLEIVSAKETRRKFQMMQVPVCQRYFHCIFNVCILDWLVTCMLLRNLNCLCIVRLFVCLFFVRLGFIVPQIFHSYGDVTTTGEGLQIFTYARHLYSH